MMALRGLTFIFEVSHHLVTSSRRRLLRVKVLQSAMGLVRQSDTGRLSLSSVSIISGTTCEIMTVQESFRHFDSWSKTRYYSVGSEALAVRGMT